MSRKSGLSDAVRGTQQLAQSSDNSQAMIRATEALVAATAECQHEMISFMSARLEKDGNAVREMMGCKNLTDALSIHSHWMEETLQDYNAAVTKLIAICSNSINGGGQIGG
jgi:hypothetical protein